jgi:hypothetical protein
MGVLLPLRQSVFREKKNAINISQALQHEKEKCRLQGGCP